MASLSIPNSFSNGTAADAVQVNANFNAVKSYVESALVQADGSVKATTASLDDAIVTTAKLASSSVTEAKIATGAVTETKIGAAAVTDAKVSLTPVSGVVKVYASTAARDSAITSPTAGMVVYVDSGDSSEGLYVYHGSAWTKGAGWNQPWGVVSYVENTTTSGSLTSETVTITSDAFTAVANRRYKITYFEPNVYVSAAGLVNARVRLTNVTGTIYQQTDFDYATNDNMPSMCTVVKTFAAGSTTLVATLESSATRQEVRGGTRPAFLLIEDIGPSGAPA